ncbi:MAG: glucose-1-phosphate thymidylyltransferase RfbA [Candidatus Kapaibacterium sp.]|jgi:glucose-1-phosphate thymidylyltransferase|nr:glucose-1-phosphate thymidylyltransferase RfbA [Candidatus Kapabacteria bacterium]
MKPTKGIVLAGGSGSRLYPLSTICSKQLQPIYDKPLIYYPLATLMLGGIRDILLITTPHDMPLFQKLLGDGSQWGISLKYAIQTAPRGLAEAFIIGEEFINNNQVCLILGDNVFYGKLDFLRNALEYNIGGTIFGYQVTDPERYGVVEFGDNGKVLSIEEKPKQPKSHYAIPGLYVFSSDVVNIAKNVKPSPRGELEITDIHNAYLQQNTLQVEIMGRGIAWLDTGTPESLLEAGTFIHAIEKRQGMKIACLEEIAFLMKYINEEELMRHIISLPNSSYRQYCEKIMTLQ